MNKRGRLIVMRTGECTPGGLFTALAYWDLLPLRGNAKLLRETVLAAVGRKRGKEAADSAAAYWRPPGTVLHDRIRAVANFTGRREHLDSLSMSLWPGPAQAADTTQAVVQGLGGAGKSTFAIQYGWKNRDRYAGVWWLGADNSDGIVDGLVAFGARFNPALNEVQDRAQAARWTLSFLADGGFEKPWLIVYSNVPGPKALEGLLPGAGAHVLITTRCPDWRGHGASIGRALDAPRARHSGSEFAGPSQLGAERAAKPHGAA